jgi:hypothetical protein
MRRRHGTTTKARALVRVWTLILAVILAPGALDAAAPVPNPTVIGPIPQNAPPGDPSHDYTFFSSEIVEDFGYVEEEYFLEGSANVYDIPALPPYPQIPGATASVVSGGHPYRTRLVVRRPLQANHFNGTVILEWLNVTGGFDIDEGWVSGSAEHFMREGYVWVGISAQLAGVHAPGAGLRAWSPTRYGTLDVTAGGAFLADELSWDIFSQAGQAVMNPSSVDVLDGLQPERIIASGASQSATRLGVYYNRVHPLANLFDGFMLSVANPPVRGDLGTPVFKLHSETDAAHVALGFRPVLGTMLPPLQSDSDTLRTWQVAGSAHLDALAVENIVALAARDSILLPPPGLCAVQVEGSRVRFFHVIDAAYDHLATWAEEGTPPPTAPPIQTAGTEIVRDSRGLALGGIRLADHAVPAAVHTGENSGPFFCVLLGASTPFDQDTLDELYPHHGIYEVLVATVAKGNLDAGYITRHAAQQTIAGAAQSGVGR